nr:hypothetical protein [Moorella mulderi]
MGDDRAFAGSDTLATSYILARAIEVISRETPVDLSFAVSRPLTVIRLR